VETNSTRTSNLETAVPLGFFTIHTIIRHFHTLKTQLCVGLLFLPKQFVTLIKEKSMLSAYLVDDEINNIENLKFLLQNDCAGIEVVGYALNGTIAREWLTHNTVDVVFLDISMPKETGLEMLQNIAVQNFNVVFVTAHNEYAIQAIKASAIDYLLKPVSIVELQNTVNKLHQKFNNTTILNQNKELVNNLIKNYTPGIAPNKIALPQLGGISFLDVNEIIALQADSNYTIIHKKEMQKAVVSKSLKDFEDILDDNQFIRIHKSYMVNINYIVEYSTIDGGMVKMYDGNMWSVSRRQTDTLLNKMKEHNILFFK
jgi:two-component system, LytTR family, response regulator